MKQTLRSSTVLRLAVFLLIFGLGGSVVHAGNHGAHQGHGGGEHGKHGAKKDMSKEEMVDHHISHMTEKLDLTSEQQSQLRPLFEASFDRKADLKENKGALSRDAYKEARQAVHKDLKRGIREVLTEEQRAAHREMHKKHHRHHKGEKGDRKGKRGHHRDGQKEY